MKSIFMRVLFCKIHCPSFICFCKPSAAAAHLYNSGPLKLDNTPHVLSLTVEPVVSTTSCDQLSGEAIEVRNERCVDEGKLEQADTNHNNAIALKSCIKRKECASDSGATTQVEKKRVQWMDNLGDELAEVKEFESRCLLVSLTL